MQVKSGICNKSKHKSKVAKEMVYQSSRTYEYFIYYINYSIDKKG